MNDDYQRNKDWLERQQQIRDAQRQTMKKINRLNWYIFYTVIGIAVLILTIVMLTKL